MKDYVNMPWFKTLLSKLRAVADEVGLDEPSVDTLKEFMLTVAREQYAAGNKSGIRWARSTPPQSAGN